MLARSSGGNARVDYAQELGSLRAAAGKTWRHAPRTARFIAKAASPVLGPSGFRLDTGGTSGDSIRATHLLKTGCSASEAHRRHSELDLARAEVGGHSPQLGGFSRRHPVLAQRLPANTRTADREERFVDPRLS